MNIECQGCQEPGRELTSIWYEWGGRDSQAWVCSVCLLLLEDSSLSYTFSPPAHWIYELYKKLKEQDFYEDTGEEDETQ